MKAQANENAKAVCLVEVIAETEPCENEKNVYYQFLIQTHISTITLYFDYVSK